MKTLAFDTSSDTISAAVLEGESISAELVMTSDRNHGETILPLIEMVCRAACVSMNEIDLFALTVGPGSFTGIRVGVSTVKGFLLAGDKPVVAVSSLDALACNSDGSSPLICPMIDARQQQIYTALYRWEGNAVPRRITEECAVPPREFLEGIDGRVHFVGNGAHKYINYIEEMIGNRASVAPSFHNPIRAGTVGYIGLKKFRDGDNVNPVQLVPRYLRSSYVEKR